MLIGGFQPTSLIDYPGTICSVIFTMGCNFRCPYCHNPSLVRGTAEQLDVNEVLQKIKQRTKFIDGVCISGGEPTLHSDLPQLLHRIKDMGLKIKLDTNGTNPDMLKHLVSTGLVDYVAMDIKAAPSLYSDVAGVTVDFDAVSASVALLKSDVVDYEFRTTFARSLVVDPKKLFEFIHGAKKYVIQVCRDGTTLQPGFEPDNGDQTWFIDLANEAKLWVRELEVRGLNDFAKAKLKVG